MRIISKWKDYYDYLAYIFGPDNHIIYERKELCADGFELDPLRRIRIEQKELPRTPYPNDSRLNFYKFKYCSICAKAYLLIADIDSEEYEVYDPSKVSSIVNAMLTRKSYWNPHSYVSAIAGKEIPALLSLHRKLKVPVFTFSSGWSGSVALIDTKIPHLGMLGVPKVYPADQIYQDISYFLSNTINESPDVSPVPVLSDKEKILTHGFDTKQSFRHRV